MTSAQQFSKEKITSESQQLGSNSPFLINALKSIILKTIALKKSYEKKIRDDLMALLLSLPTYKSVTLREKFCRNPQDKPQQNENKYAPHQLFLHKALETRNPKQSWSSWP